MSYVALLAADKPLPLYEAPKPRVRWIQSGGHRVSVEEDGFSVQKHEYYRAAVEDLGLTMKPYQYELDLRATEDDLNELQTYLQENLAPGENVELWGLWVGGEEERLARYRGPLDALNLETLDMLEACRTVCLTIER